MKKLNELVELANKANSAGQGTTEMVDFRVTANPDTILAIAEAFRTLEQRAESAEAEKAGAGERCRMMFDAKNHWAGRARAAEAKLAELEKQQPMAYRWESPVNGKICYDGIKPLGVISQPLYLRPAPAINLAELVPERKSVPESGASFCSVTHWCDGFNSCIAEIMRNIEEANK